MHALTLNFKGLYFTLAGFRIFLEMKGHILPSRQEIINHKFYLWFYGYYKPIYFS